MDCPETSDRFHQGLCHPEPAKDPPLQPPSSPTDVSVAVPCAKRACERSAWVPPQDDTHAGRVGKHLDAKRLAPLVDRLGNARLQALAFVAIGLYLLDALARRRGDVRPQRVVERPGHRLRILLRVIEALE